MNGGRVQRTDSMLCDFHIHTSSSDGDLPVRDVIDLFGREGFDAVAITDHVVDAGTRAGFEAGGGRPWWVSEEQFTGYLRTLWAEARRAWEKYSMLVIPSIEITNETAGYEILALDIKEYVDPSLPVEAIVQGIHDQGGIAIASHPHRAPVPGRTHPRFLWDRHEQYAKLFDAWEVANRDDLFDVAGLKRFNYVASSDFHHHRHLYSWKTLLQCEKNVESVKAAIHNNHLVAICLFR